MGSSILSLYLTERSYLNHVINKRTLIPLERLFEVGVGDNARVFQKIAYADTVDGDYVTLLWDRERAADYSAQGEKQYVATDVFWLEAAQMAIELKEFDEARRNLLKARAQNSQNSSARQLLRELSLLEISP
jgi:hypothetical protein